MNLVSTTVGQGPHLVLLHGWGLNSGVWQSTINDFAQHFTVTTIDLPGFGLNHANIPEHYSLFNVAELIAAAMPDKAILLGWSLGGLIAQHIALSLPSKVQELILLATSPCFIADSQWPGIKIQVLDNFKHQLLENLSTTISRFLAIQAMGSPSAKHDIKQIKLHVDSYPAANPLALTAGLDLLATCDFREELSKLLMPCHFLLGRLDSLVPVNIQQHLLQLNPAINMTVFERSSHAPFISEQQCFVEWLTNKINKDKA